MYYMPLRTTTSQLSTHVFCIAKSGIALDDIGFVLRFLCGPSENRTRASAMRMQRFTTELWARAPRLP